MAQTVPLDALLRGGRIHYEAQRYDRAKEQFARALTDYGVMVDNPTRSQIELWLGLCEGQLHNQTVAADHLLTATETDASLAGKIRANEQWQYLAWTALISATRDSYNASANEAALKYALAALEIDPSKSQTYALVANIYSALGRYEEMRAIASDLLRLDAGAPEGFSLLGLYYLQKPEDQWPAHMRAARWDSASYYYQRAISAYSGRWEQAKRELGSLLSLTSYRVDQIAWLLVQRSRMEDQSELKRYIEVDLGASKKLVDVAKVAGKLFYAANNMNVASSRAGTAMLRAAAETAGDASERFRARAEGLFAQAVMYDSTDYPSLFNLGITYYQGRKDALAEQTLQKVVDSGMKDEIPALQEQAYLWLGSAQTGLGKYQQGAQNLAQAVSMDPSNVDAWQNLGICYREIGQKAKALSAFENADKLRKGGAASGLASQSSRPSTAAPVAEAAQPLPKPKSKPPQVSFDFVLATQNGDQVLDGGERVVLTVQVRSTGAGAANGVAVKLSGSSKAMQYLGTSQTIGDIGPGETKEAKFEATLPNRIDADNGNIIIRVTEANGFDALEEKELIVAMQPAKLTRETQVVSTLVDVDAPLEQSSFRREDAYAVVVGISNYRQSALPKVTYARKDAEAMKDYLTSVCGFREGNIKLLVDDGASLSDLTAYCEEWLARNVRKGSFVFVYFAGHGTPSPDKGEAYIVPYDGEPGFVSKLYPLSRLYSSLAALPTDQVVVALDACFSGAGGRSVMEQGKRPLVAVDLEKEAQKVGNVAVLAASAGNEISQDYDAKRHGLFTYYLLKGLRGEADSDKDGWVTLGELYNYAKPKVLDESQRLGYVQSLQLLPHPSGASAEVRLARAR